jgi:hypothetical protein
VKRQIHVLRDLLLAVEECPQRVSGDYVRVYHAWLLVNGGFATGDCFDLVELRQLTATGHDLLDDLRDVTMVVTAMDFAGRHVHDADNLAVVRAYIARERLR